MELGESLEEVAACEMVEETRLTPVVNTCYDPFSGQALSDKDPHRDDMYNVVTAYICT